MERLTKPDIDNVELVEFENYSVHECLEDIDTVDYLNILGALIKLQDYEDMEEQGMLIKFDCCIGDTVYRINNVKDMIDSKPIIYECKVIGIKKEFNSTYYYLYADINEDNYSIWVDNWFDRLQIGYEFYLTRVEAEKALERILECAE